MTFAEITELWLARDVQGHVSDETLSNCTSPLRGRIFAAIGDTPVTQRRAIDIETMLLGFQQTGRSGRYMRLARNPTERSLDYAVRRDIIDRNVAAAVRTPSGPSAQRYGRLTVKQARTLLTVAADDRLGNLVTVSLLLGLRPGEAAGLTWDNIKLKGERPTLTVAASLRRTPLGALVLVQPKTPTSRRTLEIPPPVADAAGLDHLHPHLLRHAAASLLSAAGVPLEDISDTLGHRSVTVTAETYRHPIAPVRSGHMAAMSQLAPKAPRP